MTYLLILAKEKNFYFLSRMLNLRFANYDVSFKNVRIEHYLTKYDELVKYKRDTKYTNVQKIRRLRIAFEALSNYENKKSRNIFNIDDEKLNKASNDLLLSLMKIKEHTNSADETINHAIKTNNDIDYNKALVHIQKTKKQYDNILIDPMNLFINLMDIVAQLLYSKWEDERYVRDTKTYFS